MAAVRSPARPTSVQEIGVHAYVTAATELLAGRVEALAAAGLPLTALGAPADFARRVAAAVPVASRFAEAIGPVYTQAGLAEARGVTRQAIEGQIRFRRVLGLRTADGHVIIPASQLDSRLQPHPGLSEVLQSFTGIVDDWTLASWLGAPHDALDGRSVLDVLADGGGLTPAARQVVQAARDRWAR